MSTSELALLEEILQTANASAAKLRLRLKELTGADANAVMKQIGQMEAQAKKTRRRIRRLKTGQQQAQLQTEADQQWKEFQAKDPVARRAWLDRMNELLYGKEEDE